MFQNCLDDKCSFKDDILSGLTVALALVPEAVAFAFVAGVSPLVGLHAAFMIGLITAIFGGRPGMISGATGALAVVMVHLVINDAYPQDHGIYYLFLAIILMGVIQMAIGFLRLGKFIRMVPHPVMLGFVNGLAIVIFLAQLKSFQTREGIWFPMEQVGVMLGLIALTMLIIWLLPKLTKAVPSSLAAILVTTFVVIGFDLDTYTVNELAGEGGIKGGLPALLDFSAVPFDIFSFDTLQIILPYALIFAGVGLIESLLTLTVVDEMTQTRGRGNKECVGQGLANVVTGLFQGMGGCAMIGQSVINIKSGGRGRLSGITAALTLLAFILFASDYIGQIPVAALTGVMFMVVIGTFDWASLQFIDIDWKKFKVSLKVPGSDFFVLILVTAVTVIEDLAVAVVVGVIVSALVFAWEHAKRIYVTHSFNNKGGKVYELHGPLFFSSAHNFKELFNPAEDPDDVVIDFKNSRVYDHTAIEAIDQLSLRYLNEGKRLHLKHLSPECLKLLKDARELVEVNMIEDPKYHIADDKLA